MKGQKRVEELWRQFFSDPSQWWDHRIDKANARHPDFKHKQTGVALYTDGRSNPSWVKAELVAMPPGSVPRSRFSLNAMLSRYVKSDRGQEALELFGEMQLQGVQPDSFTFITVCSACANLGALEEGKRVHAQVIQSGCQLDVFVESTLIDMYVKCGSIDDAWRVFSSMGTRDVVTWTIMLSGCVKCNQGEKALELFRLMQLEGVEPDPVTFVMICSACASIAALEEGRLLHKQIVERGCESDVFVGSALVDMYAKCGSIDDAWNFFSCMPARNVLSWNAMLAGLVRFKQAPKAMGLFGQMKAEGVNPDVTTFVTVSNACASVGALEEGRNIHIQVGNSDCKSDVYLGNSLINMYAKCGSIDDARRIFDSMCTRDVVSWNVMLAGYIKCEQGQKSLELYRRMLAGGWQPDEVTFATVCNACASLVALEEGRRVHRQIIQSGCESDMFVGSTLVDMYAKCGSIDDAWAVFNRMPRRDIVCWNAMLGGLAIHGHGKEALQLFKQIHRAGVKIDNVTFVSLLSACGHSGLVEEGLNFFESMHSVYGIAPAVEHYACVVDLLGRAGRLDEAEDILRSEGKMSEDKVLWTALLGACKHHRNLDV